MAHDYSTNVVNSCLHFAADVPLYPGASISCKESWTSIYKFSVSNKLTDSATQQLLNLIRSHCPEPNSCPQTVYKLKKQVGPTEGINTQYCSICMNSVPLDQKKCKNCSNPNSQLCYFTLMPFQEHLQSIFSGK